MLVRERKRSPRVKESYGDRDHQSYNLPSIITGLIR
ncbi:unnamed protein product [Arabidopsis halleri]